MPSNPADEVVKLFFTRPDEAEEVGRLGLKAITLRIPVARLFWVEEMADHAGLSRNAMLAELVSVGISEVLSKLPDAIRDDISEEVLARQEREAD